jgi:hypothetical protein
MDDPEYFQYLSYSGLTIYEQCPLYYKLRYVDRNTVDRHTDPVGSFFGTAIGKVFEWFYEREMWKYPDVVDRALSTIRDAIVYTLEKAKTTDDFDALSATPDQKDQIRSLKKEMAEYIPKGVENIRKHKLLSEDTRTEFKLDVLYKHPSWEFPVKFGGRADFIHGIRTPHIIDGKAGAKENVDNFQLIWYATQHFLKFHMAPTRLGFVFWRSPDAFLTWVDYDEHQIRQCVQRTYSVARNIRLNMFDPKPSKKCTYCAYKGICPTGQEYIAAMPNESKARVGYSILQIDDI